MTGVVATALGMVLTEFISQSMNRVCYQSGSMDKLAVGYVSNPTLQT